MNDEAVTELTERIAAGVVAMQETGEVPAGLAQFGVDVLRLCQLAQAGASPRPVSCHVHIGRDAAEWSGLRSQSGILVPEHSSEGVGFQVVGTGPVTGGHLLSVSLGIEGALHLAGELTASAQQSTTLSERERQARLADAKGRILES